ncbi:inactive tyrosine-protein kinase PRAG1 isoform X2 [Hemicordylus capensis]|uniref:inactive tyrosine-protein kinase PRAG1 isoform X2 n=1 Tax=Hemicordylus capensis TaxID=884348 RepID=UPI00230246B6|nr:inactive tyrosine-protein kinase PRAG1 isoform X2 [Hemicordylus capensis]
MYPGHKPLKALKISKRTASGKHVLMKSAEEQRTCSDSFSNNIVRKPLIRNTPNDCTRHSPQDPSLVGPFGVESRGERNVSFTNMTYTGDVVAQEDKGTAMPSKEKLTLPLLSLCHKSPTFSDRHVGCAIDSVGCPSIHQKGKASLSETASLSHSSDLESEGGEYCSIADYCGDTPLHQDSGNTRTKVAWPESENTIPKFLGQDVAGNVRTKSRGVNFSDGDSSVLNSDSVFQREKHSPHDFVYNHLCSETETLTFSSDAVVNSSSPFGVAQGNYCCLLVRESNPIESKPTENFSSSAEPQLAGPMGPSQDEPIYAESTKRKKGPLSHSSTHARSDVLAYSPCKDQADGLWREGVTHLSCERELHDSAARTSTTITIMATHTEDDNRTIFLSSPDSAVGVQWPCVSPASHPENGKPSPFFEHVEGPQAKVETGSRGNGSSLQTASRNVMGESPAIPPKLSKGSSPTGEKSLTQSISCPVAGISDGHEDDDIPRNGTDSTVFGPSSFLGSHVNRNSPEESIRGPASSSSERRHKYYNLAWSRQCRIEEEEEEEQGLLKRTQETELENGTVSPPSTSSHHQGKKGSGQENKTGGMSKSASFAFEFPKDRNGIEEFSPPPPPPPKKQSRHFLKMNKSNSELEKLNSDSRENLIPPFQGIHVTFTTGSADSLNVDTKTFSNGGQSSKTSAHSPPKTGRPVFPLANFPACSNKDRPHCTPLQPPPLPQKKTVSRAVSSPDGFYWGPASPARVAIPTSPKLNFSQSESNVCIREEPPFGTTLGLNHRTFSSSESLEKAFKGSPSPFLHSGKNGSVCTQNKNLPPRSFSQHNMSAQVSSGSSLQLHNLLSNIDNKEGVYAKLGGLYAESLRRLVSKCEDCFMRDQKSELHFSENSWSFFKLTCNKPCCDSGDAIYYCATCSKDPCSSYAVKICKSQDTKAATSCCSPSVPVHFNIQQDCGHFVASVPSSMLRNASVEGQCPSRTATEQDCVVVITREVPHQTAADFVRDAGPSHKAKPELYERRVCFLLLQLCNGLEHLKEHSIIHRDLCLENLLLVHCRPPATCSKTKEDKHLPRLIISNFLKAKQKSGTAESKVRKNQARLAPEIVSASQYKKFDEFQTGILIYELLHQPNPFEVKSHLREQEYSQDDLPPLPHLSIYSRGLQQLAHLLLEADPIKRIGITEAKRILQCLLWGPRKDLIDQPLNHEEALHNVLHNWIDMKRALLMMKFAERAVDAERNVELEDWLCCQYLASADPTSLSKSLKLLQLL